MEKRKPISKFIKNTWTNINIRCGKYKHLQTESKCKVYKNIKIEFSREEYKNWCLKQEKYILSLRKPSIDRINSEENYRLDNIRVIELEENIKNKKQSNQYINGHMSQKIRGIDFINNKWRARITYKGKEKYLGLFKNKEEALNVFYNEYLKIYNKEPW